YIQATRFDNCHLLAIEKEQFVTLEISEYLPKHASEGYTHLHFGAIRLALTFHGRKGLLVVSHLVTSKIALLDTHFLDYQHTCIDVGTMFITLFSNFNIPLSDPYPLTTLKIEVQIVGAPQINSTFTATLHYQMVYRVQNYALDITVPQETEDALMITVNSTHVLSYKTCTSCQFTEKKDVKVESIFPKKSDEEETIAHIFSTTYQLELVPVNAFDSQGKPIYTFADPDRHKYWNICDCPNVFMMIKMINLPLKKSPVLKPSYKSNMKIEILLLVF
ncbi:LOW QUALITY PROTEIN: hypothetical protein CFOL_v3_06647, partial [Cephalotus follicularis]